MEWLILGPEWKHVEMGRVAQRSTDSCMSGIATGPGRYRSPVLTLSGSYVSGPLLGGSARKNENSKRA